MSIQTVKKKTPLKKKTWFASFFFLLLLLSHKNTPPVTMLRCEIDHLCFLKECRDAATMSGSVQQVSSYTRDRKLVLTDFLEGVEDLSAAGPSKKEVIRKKKKKGFTVK